VTATYNAHEDGAYRCYTLARDGRSRQYLDCAHPSPSEAIAHDPLSRGTAQDGRSTVARPDVPPSASSDPVPSLTGEPDGALGEASDRGSRTGNGLASGARSSEPARTGASLNAAAPAPHGAAAPHHTTGQRAGHGAPRRAGLRTAVEGAPTLGL
jgi:hypothetical protein